MTDAEIIKANDILDKFDFFSQRAGRELWSDKPKDIQDKDIENFLNDVKFLKDLINRQKAEIDALRKTILDADYSSITALKAKESWHMENSIYIYQLNERIDRLQADNSSMQSTLAKMSMGVEKAKSEAIKEFAERLKTAQSFYDGQETRIYLTEKDLDNLAKEMAGDTE